MASHWVQFGCHVDKDVCAYEGKIEFAPDGEDGLPDLERHADGSLCMFEGDSMRIAVGLLRRFLVEEEVFVGIRQYPALARELIVDGRITIDDRDLEILNLLSGTAVPDG